MTPKAIVSYDDTPTDHDALMLARVLADAGAELVLGYVRHPSDPDRDQREHAAGELLLERGARLLGDPSVERRVIANGSTASGLHMLARQEEADLIVFGSDYRTAAGHVEPQKSTQALLDGGSVAIAIAPARYRSEQARTFGRVGVLATPDDPAAVATASDLAQSLGARLTHGEPYVDLLVVGSHPVAPAGRLLLSADAQSAIENAAYPVIALPRGAAMRFPLVLTG